MVAFLWVLASLVDAIPKGFLVAVIDSCESTITTNYTQTWMLSETLRVKWCLLVITQTNLEPHSKIIYLEKEKMQKEACIDMLFSFLNLHCTINILNSNPYIYPVD